MKLADARVGMTVRVTAFERADHAAEAARLGLVPGCQVTVVQKMPNGPVVVECGVTQMAVAFVLARRVVVDPAP